MLEQDRNKSQCPAWCIDPKHPIGETDTVVSATDQRDVWMHSGRTAEVRLSNGKAASAWVYAEAIDTAPPDEPRLWLSTDDPALLTAGDCTEVSRLLTWGKWEMLAVLDGHPNQDVARASATTKASPRWPQPADEPCSPWCTGTHPGWTWDCGAWELLHVRTIGTVPEAGHGDTEALVQVREYIYDNGADGRNVESGVHVEGRDLDYWKHPTAATRFGALMGEAAVVLGKAQECRAQLDWTGAR